MPFQQRIDIACRLEARRIAFEEIVIPNDIHGFLRHASWLLVDQATASFFARALGVP